LVNVVHHLPLIVQLRFDRPRHFVQRFQSAAHLIQHRVLRAPDLLLLAARAPHKVRVALRVRARAARRVLRFTRHLFCERAPLVCGELALHLG
jgi:hypothetical protein